MTIKDVYNRLFDRIREIRVVEFAIIIKHLEGRHFRRGLEIGCGDGTQSLLLTGICDELISTDIDSSDIPLDRLKLLNFVDADAEHLPFPDKHFDLIYSSNVLEHVPDLEKAFSEMRRVLVDDGLMIHSMPNATWKVLQLVLWFPFRFKVLLAKLSETTRKDEGQSESRKTGEFGSSDKTGEAKKFNPWFPPIHGVARSHIDEIMLFRASRWINEFKKAGFKVEKKIPLLLYSAWNVGPGFIRRFLEKLGMRSSMCFFLEINKV